MRPRDFISEDMVKLLRDLKLTLDEFVPVVSQMYDDGLPVGDHLAKAREYQEYVDKQVKLFEVVT